jgi:ABC-type phosphate transport system substrate-binding protein
MSRPMTKGEADAFEKKYGYKPAHFRVAADALAIYVNKDNPVPCLTMQLKRPRTTQVCPRAALLLSILLFP